MSDYIILIVMLVLCVIFHLIDIFSKDKEDDKNQKKDEDCRNCEFAGCPVHVFIEKVFKNATSKGMENIDDWEYINSDDEYDYFRNFRNGIYKKYERDKESR